MKRDVRIFVRTVGIFAAICLLTMIQVWAISADINGRVGIGRQIVAAVRVLGEAWRGE